MAETLKVFGTIKKRAEGLIGKEVCWSNIAGGYEAQTPAEGGCGIIKEVTDTHIILVTKERFTTKPKELEKEWIKSIPIESIIGLTERKRIPKEWFE